MNAQQRRFARRHGNAISVKNCYNCYLMYSANEQVCLECGYPHAERYTFGYVRRKVRK